MSRRDPALAFDAIHIEGGLLPAEWLAIQNGQNPTRSVAFDNTLRYLSTGRDLAEVARGSAGASAALSRCSLPGVMFHPLPEHCCGVTASQLWPSRLRYHV